MFRRILVALDGSSTSNVGMKTAVELASDQHAVLVGVHVIDDASITMNLEDSYVPAGYVDKVYGARRKIGRTILDRAETAARTAGVEMKSVLVESRGQPIAQAILAEARKAKADLIVIGTHGRRGVSRLLMGSAAEAVLRAAPVPVLMVRSPEGETGRPVALEEAPTSAVTVP